MKKAFWLLMIVIFMGTIGALAYAAVAHPLSGNGVYAHAMAVLLSMFGLLVSMLHAAEE